MRPRTLTDEERRARNAERQTRWRQKNRGFERMRAKNNYAKKKAQKEDVAERVVEPAAVVKREPRRVQETHTESFDDVEGDTRVMAEQRRLAQLRGFEEAQVKSVGPWRGQMEPNRKVDGYEGDDRSGHREPERSGILGAGSRGLGAGGGDDEGEGEEEGVLRSGRDRQEEPDGGVDRVGGETPAGIQGRPDQSGAETPQARRKAFRALQEQFGVRRGIEVELEV